MDGGASTPTVIPPERRPLEGDHAPAIPSPLNPAAAKAPKAPVREREQREKKESLKKREASGNSRGTTPDVKGKKGKGPVVPLPMRYSIPEPKTQDYDPPKDPILTSHEPLPFLTPDGRIELKKPIDHAENKKAYRYSHCVADPLFHHKQYYRQSDPKPYGPRMSIEDSDRTFHFDTSCRFVTNEKGWRTSRANVFAREGSLYYEVKIAKGIPAGDTPVDESAPQPHIRMGWARREAPLDAPVGFDGYSYAITDTSFQTLHKSRFGKITLPQPKSKNKNRKAAQPAPVHENDQIRQGDVIGLLITLPSIGLHRKVVDGIYNPAVDVGDGFDDPPSFIGPSDVIRDRIPVPYRGNIYFEQFEYQITKSMETYSDRGPYNKINPHPNHEDVCLRNLPYSSINVYKNGESVGTAFEGLMAFLPPASLVPASTGARVGFDDGCLGYYPAVSSFSGGIAETNFGPNFWCPPEDLHFSGPADIGMGGTADVLRPDAIPSSLSDQGIQEKRKPKALGDRYKEQIAEDVTWDIIDEATFFATDGGYSYIKEEERGEGKKVFVTARGIIGD
ncbi:Ash2-trithorax family protein [Venturia nashicola]|uniref:Ash2-trithorax family protein n=1 Tax=Venturia nashicola TaxID=86259 RepID=A0A4Z1NR79_9PEZI|nr:Ash2-trithorax family protein [Venturia nashicola]TLD27791.1 Ash2-trithorax family protein [Venturia nashicola]